HDLGVVAGRTHDIAVMYAGQIVEMAPTRTLFSEVRMPYTEALLRSVPRVENPKHTRLAVIGGRPPDLVDPPPGCRFAPRCPYAQERCRVEAPPLVEADTPGHWYRCWYPVGTDEGREALERNLAANVPQAAAAVTGDLSVEASCWRAPARRTCAAATTCCCGSRTSSSSSRRPGARPSRRSRASASTSPRARPSGWWGRAGAASRPPPGRSCSCPRPRRGPSASPATS